MFRIISIIIGYLIGCFQTAYIMGKFCNNCDIREHGSGNAGTTNVIRILGWKAGVITFIGDLLKGVLGIIICSYLYKYNAVTASIYGGLGVILGHIFPVFLKFKGGKGIASTLGIILAINPKLCLVFIAIMILVIGVTRYVSLASIILAVIIPVSFYLLHYPIEVIVIGAVVSIITLVKHKENIKRLLSGTESKLGKKKK